MIKISSQILYSLLFICLPLNTYASSNEENLYVTWEGSEPDKGASAWLIKRFINKKAVFRFKPVGTELISGQPFDVPQSQYRRSHRFTTFESLRRAYKIEDPTVIKLGKIVHDLEINTWGDKFMSESTYIEQEHRSLKLLYKKAPIPFTCHIAYFDEIYSLLKAQANFDQRTVTPIEACKLNIKPYK